MKVFPCWLIPKNSSHDEPWHLYNKYCIELYRRALMQKSSKSRTLEAEYRIPQQNTHFKKCENPHGIVFVCLVYLVVDNSHIPLLSPTPSSVSTCALNLLIWLLSFCPNSSSLKTIPQFLPPPLLHISLILALFYSALSSLPFWF